MGGNPVLTSGRQSVLLVVYSLSSCILFSVEDPGFRPPGMILAQPFSSGPEFPHLAMGLMAALPHGAARRIMWCRTCSSLS